MRSRFISEGSRTLWRRLVALTPSAATFRAGDMAIIVWSRGKAFEVVPARATKVFCHGRAGTPASGAYARHPHADCRKNGKRGHDCCHARPALKCVSPDQSVFNPVPHEHEHANPNKVGAGDRPRDITMQLANCPNRGLAAAVEVLIVSACQVMRAHRGNTAAAGIPHHSTFLDQTVLFH